ncbi:FAM183A-like protein [Polychytrium aggregatum]|uniref:FAM183A-like protein n=1 Tax=Polychytrium aggregatum TaxID=110093 RepID=UPI0022FF2B34|nr:FAM183A-like protein [Polychytrium aggregatum]KAI9206773.1 FAM183A-like protein [Polychytrium aggregatum]
MGDKSEPANDSSAVFADAIFAETVRKEMRVHRLYEHYMLSPSVIHKGLVLTNKPTSAGKEGRIETEDEDYKKLLLSASKSPRGKYMAPVTSAQECGWDTEPLVRNRDSRFYFPRNHTEITKIYGQAFAKKL